MQEKAGHYTNHQNPEGASFQSSIRQGNRLYQKHLQPDEPSNCLSEALNEYSRALEQDANNPQTAVQMAKIFLRQGNYPKAENYAKKSLKMVNEQNLSRKIGASVRQEAYYIMGVIYFRQEELESAQRAFHQSVEAGPFTSCRARFGLFQTFRDMAFGRFYRFSALGPALQAIYSLITCLLLFPFEKERLSIPVLLLWIPRMLMAWVYEEMGMIDEALDQYLAIQRDYPGMGSVAIIIGDIYREKGEIEKACYWFEKVIHKHPGSLEAYYHLARTLEEKEDFAEMARVYEKLLRLKPADPHIYCNLANAYYYMQSYKDALANYEIALQLGTDQQWKAMVAQSIANIYCDYLQNNQAAIAYYHMARNLAPNEIENYIQLGMLYFQKEDYANAELIYRKAIRIAPDNARLHSNLGYLRWMEGDVEQAIQHYEKAISLDSGYEIPMLGEVHKAIELFQEAIEIDHHYALAYYNLGRAHSFLDNRLEAANCFRTAQELNQYSRELDNDELTARINHLFDTCEMELRD
jgi:tetratricopeptide (TPR) repeat protein